MPSFYLHDFVATYQKDEQSTSSSYGAQPSLLGHILGKLGYRLGEREKERECIFFLMGTSLKVLDYWCVEAYNSTVVFIYGIE